MGSLPPVKGTPPRRETEADVRKQTWQSPDWDRMRPKQDGGYYYTNKPLEHTRVGPKEDKDKKSKSKLSSSSMVNGSTTSNLSSDVRIPIDERRPSKMSLRTLELIDGKYIIQIPVSTKVLGSSRLHTEKGSSNEFTHLRYTAVTAEPDNFVQEKYNLRQNILKRKTRIAVVITMYNEDDVLFCRSFRAVMRNIAYLCSGRALWTSEGWKEVVVVIVADGRKKINRTVLTVLGVQGIFLHGLEKSAVEGKPTKAHLYEFTTQVSVDADLHLRDALEDDGELKMVPVQTIFLLKEENKKKINSHRWFFNAVCKALNPEVCILIDVGTKPTKESFWHLYNSFHYDPMIGGACGEIAAELGPRWKNLINPLVAVQNFEYKMSNILDKPLESIFGYISVLPGAFSAYRYEALQGPPLETYFKGEEPHGNNVGEANMYLAEDRILCFELVMKREKSYLLKYVKSARASTDVPENLDELISQRRRWLNGSFFASVHATTNWMRIFQSRHTKFRKYFLLFEFIYNFINLYFTWFNIGNFYLSFYFLFDIANSSGCGTGVLDEAGLDPFYPKGQLVFNIIKEFYLGALITIFIASLGNRPQGSKLIYLGVCIMFAALMVLMLFMAIWTIQVSVTKYNKLHASTGVSFNSYVSSTPTFRDILISLCTTYGLYFVSSILHLEPWHCFTCILQYLLLLPTFVNIFMVYAFCNINDVTWGTKGDNTASTAEAVKTEIGKDGERVAKVELPAEADAMWKEYEKQLKYNALTFKTRREEVAVNAKTEHEDFFKEFRTKVVLAWMLSNCILIFVFTNANVINTLNPSKGDGVSVNPYLTFLFWSVTVISAIRGLFSTVYMFQWWNEFLRDSGKQSVQLKKISPA